MSRSDDETETKKVATNTKRDVWKLCESPPDGCEAVADLYHWSTNFDVGKGPITLFLDMIGWSDEYVGEPMYGGPADMSLLGFVELQKLGLALVEYSEAPTDVKRFVDELIEAEESS